MSRLPLKLTAVQHPLERIAQIFTKIGGNIDFKDFLTQVVLNDKYEGQLKEELLAYNAQCNFCQPGFEPSHVLKSEFLNVDLIEVLRELSFGEVVQDLPEDFYRLQEFEKVSLEAREVYSTVAKKDIMAVWERYRLDHEVFGYDPRPYVELGKQ